MSTHDIWQGRDDSAEQGITTRMFQIIQNDDSTFGQGDAVVMGFASDAGVARNQGRTGAADGPDVAKRMLAGLPAHKLEKLWDAGNVEVTGDKLEEGQQALAAKTQNILDRGARLVVIGGGHEIAWGDFQGLRDHLFANGDSGRTLQIINIDAHFDLRTSRPGSSGTPFDQIMQDANERGLPVKYACFGVSPIGNTPSLYARADELGVHYAQDTMMQERYLDARLAELDTLLNDADDVYFTIDTDCMPAAVAPGVSAPAPLGVPVSVVEAFADHIKASGKLRLADIAEFNPRFDIDNHTARVVARLMWKLLQP